MNTSDERNPDTLGHSTVAGTDRYLRDVAPIHLIDTMRVRSWQDTQPEMLP